MKKTAQQLREEAKKLMEQAKQLEEEQATKIGKVIIGYAEKKWSDKTEGSHGQTW